MFFKMFSMNEKTRPPRLLPNTGILDSMFCGGWMQVFMYVSFPLLL